MTRARFVLLLILAAALILGIEFLRRQDLYWYDVRQDYRFDFYSDRALPATVHVSETGFVVPPIPGDWDTAILRLQLSAKPTGYWFEPYVSIEGNGITAQQYFERGASGFRFISLSGLQLRAGDVINLRGHHLKWTPHEGALLLFRNQNLKHKKLLVLAPHPDDAEIAAFGLYSEHHSYVATITTGSYVDGRYAHLYEDSDRQDELLAEMRSWDSISVPLLGGVQPQRIVSLGYKTGSLEQLLAVRDQGSARPDSSVDESLVKYRRGAVAELLGDQPASNSWSGLVADMAALLGTIKPDIIVTPHPGLDAAPDHQLTTLALIEALDNAADSRIVLFLYTNHHILAEYYPFGPSDSLVGLPPWFQSDTYFGSIYSHPVGQHQQVKKLFSLEAMHDLRAAPHRFYGGPTYRFLSRLHWAAEDVVADPLGTYSYFRRAVRPNEIFFVYEPAERHLLRSFADEQVKSQ